MVVAPTVQGTLGSLVKGLVAEEQPVARKPTKKGAKAKGMKTEAVGKPKAKRGRKRKVMKEMASTAEPAKKTRRRTKKKATAEPEKRLQM